MTILDLSKFSTKVTALQSIIGIIGFHHDNETLAVRWSHNFEGIHQLYFYPLNNQEYNKEGFVTDENKILITHIKIAQNSLIKIDNGKFKLKKFPKTHNKGFLGTVILKTIDFLNWLLKKLN